MKKQNKKNMKKNARTSRNIYGQKCIAKKVTFNKENALDQYIEILNDIEQHRQMGINIEYDIITPMDVFSQEEIAALNKKMSSLMMLRYGFNQMNMGEASPVAFPMPVSIA